MKQDKERRREQRSEGERDTERGASLSIAGFRLQVGWYERFLTLLVVIVMASVPLMMLINNSWFIWLLIALVAGAFLYLRRRPTRQPAAKPRRVAPAKIDGLLPAPGLARQLLARNRH